MSRLWDTPEFWARAEADEVLRDYPDTEAGALADMFERTQGGYDGDPELARDVIGELRRRADAGIRFWPTGLALVPPPPAAALPSSVAASFGGSRPARGNFYGFPR